MGLQNPASIAALRSRVARLETAHATRLERPVLRFGLPAIDGFVPAGGLLTAALHEFSGAGDDTEYGAAPTQLIAALSVQCPGTVIWVVDRDPPFAPGLAGCGLAADRVIYAEAGKDVLGVMEDCLRHPGLAAVVGELSGRLSLTASRRLQLVAEGSGATTFALRRSLVHDDPALREPTAALTRWQVACMPSPPALPYAPEVPGVGRARRRLELQRARGGQPRAWLVEAPDHDGRLAFAADPASVSGFDAGRHRRKAA